jgi:hypothetical protein
MTGDSVHESGGFGKQDYLESGTTWKAGLLGKQTDPAKTKTSSFPDGLKDQTGNPETISARFRVRASRAPE